MKIGSLCSGYEGLARGVQAVLGGELAWVADNDAGAAKILARNFPLVPNLGDITAVDWTAVEPVDVLCAGFPCQDISCAGARRGLREGTRSGVWAHVALAIETLRPPMVVIENVGGLLSADADSHVERCPWCMGTPDGERPLRALGAVLGDLAVLRFDADWIRVSAADAGSCHLRERVFIHAWPAADAKRNPVQRRGVPGVLGGPQQAAAGVLVKSEAPEWQREWDGHAVADRSEATPEDPDRAVGGERRLPGSGQTPGGRAWADAGGPGGARVAADAASGRRERVWPGGRAPAAGHSENPDGGGRATAHPGGTGLPLREVQHHGPELPSAQRGDRDGTAGIDWRQYEPAIRRWEVVLGRPAPNPTQPGRTGPRLSPAFVEWMQGLPEGWVTGVPGLSRNAQLKALGNGCVPQQVELALRSLLGAVAEAA